MAEKFWCKHCKVFVVDTKFERAQHDSTFKHKANYQRALNAIHRENIESKKQNNASERAFIDIEKALKKSGKSFASNTSIIDNPHFIEKPGVISNQENTRIQATPDNLTKADNKELPIVKGSISNKWVGTTTNRVLNKDELEAQKRQLVQLGVNFADVKNKLRAENAEASQWVVVNETTVDENTTPEEESQLGKDSVPEVHHHPFASVTIANYQAPSITDRNKANEYNKWNLEEKIAPTVTTDDNDDLPPIVLKRKGCDLGLNKNEEKSSVKIADGLKTESKNLAKPSLFKMRKLGINANSRKN
ncbi:hypothetical protein NADFUDRAFT_79260 [Nadsonia fulvescens var. elongata DSM 6958]|uniref:U1-type domain-containing protein n=1 Tax=Nadsonia fulvescens var. elongata DSM 6958 TaxID=857566 RepID=A0A1E3PIX3_9ASCO|nr:hypothetical protein NADFUDRAFT_79260 [Nadsonia fulvescens var. elongata DSM 6958]